MNTINKKEMNKAAIEIAANAVGKCYEHKTHFVVIQYGSFFERFFSGSLDECLVKALLRKTDCGIYEADGTPIPATF